MITLAWYVGGGYLLLAAVVGLVVGRVVRNRDRQIPHDQPDVEDQPEQVDAEERNE